MQSPIKEPKIYKELFEVNQLILQKERELQSLKIDLAKKQEIVNIYEDLIKKNKTSAIRVKKYIYDSNHSNYKFELENYLKENYILELTFEDAAILLAKKEIYEYEYDKYNDKTIVHKYQEI